MISKDNSCFGSASGDLILVEYIAIAGTDKDIEGDRVILKV